MAKVSSPRAVEVIAICRDLNLIVTELRGGIIAQLPSTKAFIKAHDISEESHAKITKFKRVVEILKEAIGSKFQKLHPKIWIWETGSLRVQFTLAAPIARKKSKPKASARKKPKRVPGKRSSQDAMFRRLPGHYGSNQ